MIDILIVSHGNLGTALIRSAEMIMGPVERVYSVALLRGEAPEGFDAKLSAALAKIQRQRQKVGKDGGTLVLIDLFGGTPYNTTARLVLAGNYECVTGVSLPMLLEVLCARENASLEELAALAVQAGQDAVKNLGPLLRKSKLPGTAEHTINAGT